MDDEPTTTAHTERVLLSSRDLALLDVAAELEGMTVADYLRAAGMAVAREVLGLEVYDAEELAELLAERYAPAEA
jgi:predicted DNA-binding protein (UPF0278 family)